MAEHEMWVWIAIYGLACVSSGWLGWLAWRTVAPFALAVAVLGLELPLAVVGAGLDGARGAATGVVVGLMLASVPIMVAVMWLVVAGPGAIARLPQIRQGVLPYACVDRTRRSLRSQHFHARYAFIGHEILPAERS